MLDVSLSIPDSVGESLSVLPPILVSTLATFLVVNVVQFYILSAICRKMVKLLDKRDDLDGDERRRAHSPGTVSATPAGSRQFREWHSLDEFARIVGRPEITCRELCRLGRIRAKRKEAREAPPRG